MHAATWPLHPASMTDQRRGPSSRSKAAGRWSNEGSAPLSAAAPLPAGSKAVRT